MAISQTAKCLRDHGEKISLTLTSTNYGRSPLVQGGLEITCKINVNLLATIKSHMLLRQYEEVARELYCESKGEEVIGSFLALTTSSGGFKVTP